MMGPLVHLISHIQNLNQIIDFLMTLGHYNHLRHLLFIMYSILSGIPVGFLDLPKCITPCKILQQGFENICQSFRPFGGLTIIIRNEDWPKVGPPDPGTPDHVTTKLVQLQSPLMLPC